jgi:hypothetical protein
VLLLDNLLNLAYNALMNWLTIIALIEKVLEAIEAIFSGNDSSAATAVAAARDALNTAKKKASK